MTQREHLRYLTKITDGTCHGSHAQPVREIRPAVLALLGQHEPGLALVTNRLGDVLACTSGFELLAGPLGLLDDLEPNLTRFVFTDPRARDAFPDWDALARLLRPAARAGPGASRDR